MQHEGRLREHARKWDEFVDVERYGILARDMQRPNATPNTAEES